MKQKIFVLILSLIVLFGTGLRLFQLNHFPPELFGDEVDVGYQAYSLLHTGRDYRGELLPTYIHSFSEWRAPLLMYTTAPSVAVFGLTPLSVRLVPAFFGILGIMLIFYLGELFFTNRKIGLFAAFCLAISPWHIQYSREAYEVTLLFDLFVFGLYCFLKSFNNPKWLIGAAISFALMFYTYSTTAVFLPLACIILLILYWKQLGQIPRKWLGLGSIIGLVILTPFIFQTVTGKAGARFGLISIFANSQSVVNQIEIARNVSPFPPNSPFLTRPNSTAEKLAHNKMLSYGIIFATNYLQAFSTDFLFLTGDPNPRQSVGQMGELYLAFLPLLLLGIAALIKHYHRKAYLVFGLLAVAPIPSALTVDGGVHATRLFLMLLPLTLIMAVGAQTLFDFAKEKIVGKLVLLIIVGLLLANFSLYLHRYYIHAPAEGFAFWQYGYADGLQYIASQKQNYDRILVTAAIDPPLTRTLFYLNIDPAKFQKSFTDDKILPNVLPGFDGFSVENLYFVVQNDATKKTGFVNLIDNRTLYFISQKADVGGDWDWRKNPPSGIKVLHTTLDPLGQPLFYVVTHA